MSRRSRAAGDLGRANEPAILILTSLASGSKHGYTLAKDIGEFAGVTLGPGTLYGAISRLEQGGSLRLSAGSSGGGLTGSRSRAGPR
jgi:DNA-binding PadR family transcriptional regulator